MKHFNRNRPRRQGAATPPQAPWYKSWFNEHYVALYAKRDAKDAAQQLSLIERTLPLIKADQSAPSPILDAGCGYGRHVQWLKNRGYAVRGIDLSSTLIAYGLKMDATLPITQGELRHLTQYVPQETFSAVLSLFTSFGYFDTVAEHIVMLKNFHAVLKPQGWLWLDFLNPAYVKTHFSAEPVQRQLHNQLFTERKHITAKRIYKTITVESLTQPSAPVRAAAAPAHYRESIALYTPKQVMAMGKKSGFSVQHLFGNYHGQTFTNAAPRAIFVLQKQ